MRKKLLTFWERWRVFVTGMVTAAIVAIYEISSNPASERSAKMFILAALLAAIGYIAKEWRGQGTTIFSFVGLTIAAIMKQETTGIPIDWWQLLSGFGMLYLGAAAPNPKPITYEMNKTIVEAKELPAKNIVEPPPASLPPPEVPIENSEK